MSIKPAVPTITSHDFAQLSQAEQLDVLRCQDARNKARLLVDAANGADLLARLPVQEVYLLAMDRGPEYLSELLALATPEQWTGFIDLDCWHGDDYLADKAHRWMATLLEGEDEMVFNILQRMDFEQLTLILKNELEIVTGPESIDDDDARVEAVKRDGGYEINYRSENSAKLFGKLIDILQRNELEFFIYVMEAVRSESKLMLEESVYQQRAGRLLDMGITDSFEALKVYAWLDPEQYRKQPPYKLAMGEFTGSAAPGFPLTLVKPKGLLAEVLAEGIDDNLAWEIASVVNKVLMADRVEMGHLEEVSSVINKVDSYLSLALEWLAGQDIAMARKSLDDCYVEDLFRLGYSLTLGLQRRAAAIDQTTIAPYLDLNAKACVAALMQKPPRYFEGVGDPAKGGTRMFAELYEISSTEQWLDRIELQRRLFEEGLQFELPGPEELNLSGCQPDDAEELTLVEFFLTSLANRLLGRDFLPVPIAEEELAGLHGMVSQSGMISPRLCDETANWLESLVEGGSMFAEYCMDIWEEEFCAVSFEDIDPRYIGGLIIRLEPLR